MSEKTHAFLVGLVAGIWAIVIIVEIWPEWTEAYKKGQIDALENKVHWHPIKQLDGTTTWEYKDE